jgi:cytidylate kinase
MAQNGAVKNNNPHAAGPVITISREVGCNGLILAKMIAERLNLIKPCPKWKVISKEVFFESAKELHMDPEQIRKTLHQSEKFAFEEILKAFTDKNYKSDLTIVKTIKGVIHNFATDGNCIIVGRAGNIIASDIKNALHIRLVAPLDYRIDTIMRNNQLNRAEANNFIHRVDQERLAFRKAIQKENIQNELFDITFNRAAFTDDEIMDIIEFAAKRKQIF